MKSEVFNVDCMVGMAQYPDKYFDLCVTDPPYGVDISYNSFNDSKHNTKDFIKLFMPEILRVSKRAIITTGVKLMREYPEPDWTSCYFTPAGVGVGSHGFCCWHPILIYGKDTNSRNGSLPDSFQWTGSCDKESLFHPVPKPLKLWKKIIKRWISEDDKIVFDPFTGSGTSRIVCDIMNIDFVGYEIDKDYFEAQEKRWRDYKAQLVIRFDENKF